ncbi:hypothetical protein BDB00DRAFT_772239 [Zychaea mexicana]|uniref:uncharacterized protein n=1 Tax=Zychaea mexicana TaxID=64656 RepID=UPI0022FE1F9D|nr:uncharacterized protein BDB00DRAFT_772239 [Zychaea mexicana]KAI9488604.1 hypothetical protein BDB00DRAFT_772239 [Zychaea mexicana]
MAKSKRAINPADALRKKQRKRELKKNKEDRKRARELALSKRDTAQIKGDIQRLENQGKYLLNAQAALAERQKKQQQQQESRKMVYDPKTNKFVPVKIKGNTHPSTICLDDHSLNL